MASSGRTAAAHRTAQSGSAAERRAAKFFCQNWTVRSRPQMGLLPIDRICPFSAQSQSDLVGRCQFFHWPFWARTTEMDATRSHRAYSTVIAF